MRKMNVKVMRLGSFVMVVLVLAAVAMGPGVWDMRSCVQMITRTTQGLTLLWVGGGFVVA
jgi:hypothetical protein